MFDFKEFVEKNKIKQSELMELFQVSQPTVSNMINGRMPVPRTKMLLLYNKYGRDKVDKFVYDSLEVGTDSSKVRLVPLIPVSAHGGTLSEMSNTVFERDCEKVISPISDVDYAIMISGDSMAPEYPNGSYIFIKRIDEKRFIDWGKAYVLDTYNGVVVKLLAPSERGEAYVRCVSVNKDPIYAPFDVAWDDVFGVYRVKLCMSLK